MRLLSCFLASVVTSVAPGFPQPRLEVLERHATPPKKFKESAARLLRLSNGYTNVEIDLLCPQLTTLAADPRGGADYGANLLAAQQGVRLEVQPFDQRGSVADMQDKVGAMPQVS